MMPADDERLLRVALDHLTSDQPPAPPSRYGAIRRKAAKRRRHQIVTAAAAVLAAAAVSAAITLHGRLSALSPVPPAHHGGRSKVLQTMMSGLPMPAGTNFQLLVSAGKGAAWYSTATRRSEPVTGLPASSAGYQFQPAYGGWVAVSNKPWSYPCSFHICAGPPTQFYFIADGSLAATRIGTGYAEDGVVPSSRPGAVWLATYPRASFKITGSASVQLVSTTGRPLGPRYRLPANYLLGSGVGRYLLLVNSDQQNLFILWDPRTGHVLRHFANVIATGPEQIAWSPGCQSCRVRIVNVKTGTTVTTAIAGSYPSALNAAFSDDGSLLAVQLPGREIQVFDTASRSLTAIPGTALPEGGWQQFGWQGASHRLVIAAVPPVRLRPAQVGIWQPGDSRLHIATIWNLREARNLQTGALG